MIVLLWEQEIITEMTIDLSKSGCGEETVYENDTAKWVCVCLCRKELKRMHEIDEDNILSQLATAWFNLTVVSICLSVILLAIQSDCGWLLRLKEEQNYFLDQTDYLKQIDRSYDLINIQDWHITFLVYMWWDVSSGRWNYATGIRSAMIL